MFTCLVCSFQTLNSEVYDSHLRIHKYCKIASFCCHICQQQFSKYVTYISHKYRNHPKRLLNTQKTNKNQSNIKCKVSNCSFVGETEILIVRHALEHIKNFQTRTECPLFGCSEYFSKMWSFRSHLRRSHSFQFKEKTIIPISSVLTSPMPIAAVNCVDEFQELDIVNKSSSDSLTLNDLLLQLKTKHNLPEKVINLIINEFSQEVFNCRSLCAQELEKIYSKFNLPQNVIDEINNNILPKIKINKNDIVASTYKRNNYLKNRNNYVGVQQIYLGKNKNHKDCHYHYVSILETLKILMLDTYVNKQLLLPEDNRIVNDIYVDYTDGLVYRNNIFFNIKKLEIILYMDAFEVCNPLGSAKVKHKIMAVYFILGNLPPHNRSQVDNVQLIFLCKESHLKTFGYTKIFQKLISDLKCLENEGIPRDVQSNILGSLIAICGDNLGLHQIGGFLENFSTSQFFCRYCYITMDDFRTSIKIKKEQRSPDMYNKDLKELLNFSIPNCRGIKQTCVFNGLKFFHICNPGLPPCIAHDLYEGIVPKDLNLFIQYFVEQGSFSFEYINNNMRYINSSLKLNTSFPEINKKTKRIPGHAHQNYTFLIIFPLVILNCEMSFDYENPVWELLLDLIEICKISSSYAISFNQVYRLEYLIDRYLNSRLLIFPDEKLIPKHHYLQHYPNLIRQFGPLSKFSTLRFESKHQYFKQIIRNAKNFKNVTKLLVERHQLYQNSLHSRFTDFVTADKVNCIVYSSYEIDVPSCYKFQTKCAKFREIQYNSDSLLPIYVNEINSIVAIKIDYIFINEPYTQIAFIGSIHTMELEHTKGVFIVEKLYEEQILLKYTNLLSPFPIKTYELRNTHYAVLPHSIPYLI